MVIKRQPSMNSGALAGDDPGSFVASLHGEFAKPRKLVVTTEIAKWKIAMLLMGTSHYFEFLWPFSRGIFHYISRG